MPMTLKTFCRTLSAPTGFSLMMINYTVDGLGGDNVDNTMHYLFCGRVYEDCRTLSALTGFSLVGRRAMRAGKPSRLLLR